MFLETSGAEGWHDDRVIQFSEAWPSEPCDWTILVPFFNERDFLPATLRSIAALKGAFRLVLIDNGSTDGSAEVAQRECAVLGLPVTLVTEPCPGKVHALRAGLAQVTSRYVATFDADTHYPADYLVQAGKLLAQPGVVAAGAYYTPGRERRRRDLLTGLHICLAGKLLAHQCHAGGAGQAFETKALREAGGFDANRWNLVLEDHEIIHRVGKLGKVAYGMDFWCHPSPRERDRASIRWTLAERLTYHFTPAKKQGGFFYDYLGPRLRARKLSSEKMRERQYQAPATEPTGGKLVVCADDFGLTQSISQSIVTLARRGKLNAISCMSVCPGWERDASLLRDLPAHVQIGLHLTLTEEEPLTAMPVLAWNGVMPGCNELGRRAMLRRLPLGEVRAEIAAQFDRFVDVFGRAPDFVDGHQHVHVLKGIRELILAETARRAPGAWVRNCVDKPAAMMARSFPFKAMANALQSRGVRRAVANHGLRCNDSFAGLYDFAGDYEALFPSFLDKPGAFHLVICHPGSGYRPADTIAEARRQEAAALRRMPVHEMAAARGLNFGVVAPTA